jgi:hypothetical protein
MTTATIETHTANVTTKRAALDAAIAAAGPYTGQGEVAFCRSMLARAEAEFAAAQTAAVAKAAADAKSLAEYEAHKSAQLLARAAARRGDSATRTPSRSGRRGCTCGHCMACIGE